VGGCSVHQRIGADFGVLLSMTEHPATGLRGPRVELGTERESLLQMLHEDAYFRGQPAARRPNRKDRHRSFKGSQKAYNSTFSEFCGEEPCWRLGNPKMFKDTHPHLFNIAGSKDSCGDNTLCVLPGAKAPRLYRTPLDKNDTSKAVEIVRRFRCAVSCEVLRSGDENNHRLRESSRNQSGVRKIT
jgi:hypothetical protein